MAKADKLLERMRVNPRDCQLEDVIAGVPKRWHDCTPPSGGSHHKIKHAAVVRILTIPARQSIKPVYIRELVKFVDDVLGAGG